MNQEKPRYYFDNAATTRVRPEVAQEMLEAMRETYGNPSSIHAFGRDAFRLTDRARGRVAAALAADASEITFTGSGTEADNWALKGVMAAYARKGKHLITSAIEHPAVLHTAQQMEKGGYRVTYLPVDGEGFVSPADFKAAIAEDTVLASIMLANNEIGTLQPIAQLAAIAREAGVLFHTDAVQAVGSIDVNAKALGVDLLTLSGHKFGGPKGVGALYVKKGVRISPLLNGGAQERGRRAGTENVPGIVGLGKAIELAVAEIPDKADKIRALRDQVIEGVLKIPDVRINGPREERLPGNASFCVRFIEGEALLLSLDMQGFAVSSGSACASGSLDPSHVLLAIGLPHEIAHGSVRVSLNQDNTQQEVALFIEALAQIVDRLRAMSPLFLQREGELKHV